MLDRGKVGGTLFVQSVFGLLGGIGGHSEDVQMMRRTADRLFGEAYQCRCSVPVRTSCGSEHWRRRWAGMSASGSKIRSGPDRVN